MLLMTQKLFEDAFIEWASFTQNSKAKFSNTRKKGKAKKAIQELRQTKIMSTYTHMFNLHSHDPKCDIPTVISEYIQVLKKNICICLLMSQAELTGLATLTNFDMSMENTINGAENTNIIHIPLSYPGAMNFSATKGNLKSANKENTMQVGLCFCCGELGHMSPNSPTKPKTKGKGKYNNNP